MIFTQNTTLQKVIFLFSTIALFSSPMLDARLSPKQRGRKRQERIASQYQLKGNEELVHFNKWFIGLTGGAMLTLGALSTALVFYDPTIASQDRIVLSICGPLCAGLGMNALKYLFQKGPYLIINEEGIRSADYGFIAWDKIASLDTDRQGDAGILKIFLIDGTQITIVDSLLSSSVKDILRKIGCFKEVVYSSELGVFLLADHPTEDDTSNFTKKLDECVQEIDSIVQDMNGYVYSKK